MKCMFVFLDLAELLECNDTKDHVAELIWFPTRGPCLGIRQFTQCMSGRLALRCVCDFFCV